MRDKTTNTEYYLKNRERILANRRKYYQAHWEKQREQGKRRYMDNRERILNDLHLKRRSDPQYRKCESLYKKKWNRKVAALWGAKQGKRSGKENVEIAIRSELFVAQTILPKHGFIQILLCRTFAGQFPFDILAKKNGKITAIEVTTGLQKSISPEKQLLLDFLEADLYVCHLKPDFSRYFLISLDTKRKFSTTCKGIFMESIKTLTPPNVEFLE